MADELLAPTPEAAAPPEPLAAPSAPAPAQEAAQPVLGTPGWAEDLMQSPPSFWRDAESQYNQGVLNADDFYLLHRHRVADDDNPMKAHARALQPPPPPIEMEMTSRPEETGAPPEPRGIMADVALSAVRGVGVGLDEAAQGLLALVGRQGPDVTIYRDLGPGAPQTGYGELAQGITQFLVNMVPAARGIRGLTGAGHIATALMASPVASFFAFDAHDPRLSNLIESTFPGLSTPITQYLQADPADTQLEGRFKNVLEGVLTDAAATSVFNAVRFLKQGRAVMAHVRTSQAGEILLPGPGVKLPGVPDDVASLAQQYEAAVIEARRGGPRAHALVQAEAQALIDSGQVSMETVQRILPGTTLDDANAVAVVKVLAQSGERIKVLAGKALETGHPDDVAAAFQQLYLHAQVDPKKIGVVTEAGRTVSAMNDPTSGLNRFLLQFEELLRDQTKGADPMAMLRAIADFDTADQLDILAKQTAKPGFWDMFKEYYVNGLLWGPKTWVANGIGNSATTLWSVPERGLAGILGRNKGVQAGEAWEMMHGIFGSMGDGWRLAAEAFRQEESQFGKFIGRAEDVVAQGYDKMELPQKAISGATFGQTGSAGAAIDFLGTVVRFPSRILAGTDDFFKVINYRAELRAQSFRAARHEANGLGLTGKRFADHVNARQMEMLADPPVSIKRAAEQHALYQTFTKELGPAGQKLQALANTPAGKIVLPFVRTPINIFKYATERTPMGLLMSEMRADLGGADLAKADLAKAKLALGSMTMSLAGLMAYEGVITGGGPKDPEQQRTLKALGWQPYSVRIGNEYVSFSRTEPIGMLLGLAADWVDAVNNADADDSLEWTGEVGAAVVTAVAKNFSSRTFVKGIAETFAALADPERAATSRTSSFLISLLPASGLVRQVEQVVDPTMAEATNVMDRLKSQIPGLSSTLPPRRDPFGNPLYMSGVYGPVGMSSLKDDAVLREMVKLDVHVPEIPKKVEENIGLESEERDYWAVQRGTMKINGKDLHETMEARMAGQEYQDAKGNPQRQAFLLELDVNAFHTMARTKMKDEYEVIQRSINKAREDRFRNPTAPAATEGLTPLLKSLTR